MLLLLCVESHLARPICSPGKGPDVATTTPRKPAIASSGSTRPTNRELAATSPRTAVDDRGPTAPTSLNSRCTPPGLEGGSQRLGYGLTGLQLNHRGAETLPQSVDP